MRDIHRERLVAQRMTNSQAARREDRYITLWSRIALRLEDAETRRERRDLVERLWRTTLAWRTHEYARRDAAQFRAWQPRPDSRAQWELEATR